MNDPASFGAALEPADDADEPDEFVHRRSWIDRNRRRLLLLIPLLAIGAVFAAGLPFGGWRSLTDVLQSTDLTTLIPGMRQDPAPLAEVLPAWLITAGFAAALGAMVWVWRAGSPGFGFVAAVAAFWCSLLIEIARWFKPGVLPDFRDPLIAAIVAPTVWRILRRLPGQPVTPLPRHGPWMTRRVALSRSVLIVFAIGIAVAAAFTAPLINQFGYAPTQVATLIDGLPDGRAGFSAIAAGAITKTAELVGLQRWLTAANRLDRTADLPLPNWTGADTSHDGVLPAGQLRSVNTVDALRQAIDSARPGDVILLQPGFYSIRNRSIAVTRPGTADAPITLRAPRLGLVTLDSDQAEAVKIQAPHWRFENLILRGVCSNDGACDNGFHVVGEAADTILSNVRVEDFNAQIKINGEGGKFPDNGRIEHSTLINSHARDTDASVTPIDLVAADGWVVDSNLIADFVRKGANSVSYGAYAKGAAHGTVFSHNVVLCEWHLRGAIGSTGQTVGLSFGGGGTGPEFRRDGGVSGYEHVDGVMADNLIAFCSDDGIYLNRAANAVLRHNTLLATSGIDVRFTESMAHLDGNLVDGAIRARDNALFWGEGNEATTLTGMFVGHNPARAHFVDPARLDLRWKSLPELVHPDTGTDLCGADWGGGAVPAGAFQDFRQCGAATDAGK